MPFLDDTGPRQEHRTPTWEAFAVLASQLERLVTANVAWSLNLLPGVLAVAFPEWPTWIRGLLGFYSATTIIPATAALYEIAAHACQGQQVSLEVLHDALVRMSLPSMRAFAPLCISLAGLAWAVYYVAGTGSLHMLGAPLTLAFLLWSVCAMYWGPLLTARTRLSAFAIARASVRMVAQSPGQSLASWAVILLTALVGAISIGGLFLVVPILVALSQTTLHDHANARSNALLDDDRDVSHDASCPVGWGQRTRQSVTQEMRN